MFFFFSKRSEPKKILLSPSPFDMVDSCRDSAKLIRAWLCARYSISSTYKGDVTDFGQRPTSVRVERCSTSNATRQCLSELTLLSLLSRF